MAAILIIDDDPEFGHVLAEVVKSLGHTPSWAINLAQGLEMASRVKPEVIFLDVFLPDGNGLDAVAPLKDTPSRPEVIVVTGLVDAEGAESAIRGGAWDYIEKSSSPPQLALSLKRALRFRDAERAGLGRLRREHIAGDGARMGQVLALAARAAAGELPVLILGESGTGKELFARCIHENSSRAQAPFIVIDCASLPENLVESILFGHAKGAFTGADAPRLGLVKAADHGTLFLDEVGELPLATQKSFLRVLQEHKFRPVGGRDEVVSDFRLIAATNRNLEAMAECGAFRQDLFYRLRAAELCLPPLRHRLEDLSALAVHYLNRMPGGPRQASPELLEELALHHWPGNVRELFQALDKAAAMAGEEWQLYPEHLPQSVRSVTMKERFRRRLPNRIKCGDDSLFLDPSSLPLYREHRDRSARMAERKYMEALFVAAGGSIMRARAISGLSRTRVYSLAKLNNIPFSSLS